jgi:hypothetical protein
VKHVGTEDSKFRTPAEWLPAAAQCTEYVNRIARRSDLGVSIGPDAAMESGTAWFMPTKGEIELSAKRLLPGVKAKDFDLSDKLWKLKQAQFVGAMAHEAAHAAFSVTVPMDLHKWRGPNEHGDLVVKFTPREIDVLTALEESRIEYLLLKRTPSLRKFLRRMAMEIVNSDFKVADTRYGASIGAALTVARVDAGSVSRPAGKRFGKILRERLDYSTLVALRKLWMEYHRMPMTTAYMYPYAECKRIAAAWIALVVDEDEAEREDLATDIKIMISMAGEGDPGDPSEAEGSGTEATGEGSGSEEDPEAQPEISEELGDAISKALAEVARDEAMEADTEIGEDIKDEMSDRKMAERVVDANRREEGKAEADRTFKPMRGAHAFGGAHGRRTLTKRAPRADERAAATRLSQELLKITTHDKVATRMSSMLPPGRVHGKSAVTGSAQLAQRQMVTAEPFVTVRRRHVDSDKLAIGVALDVSGSMGSATEPLGVLNYVVAAAANKVDANFCSVLFGARAEGMVKPGQKVADVVIASAVDGTEMVAPALKTIDSMVNLLDGSGARVLIMATDAHFVQTDQGEYAKTFMRLCKSHGVTVIWCHWGGMKTNYGYGSKIDLDDKTPAECANILGREIVRAVKANQN